MYVSVCINARLGLCLGLTSYACRGEQVVHSAGFLLFVSSRLMFHTPALRERYYRWLDTRHRVLDWNTVGVLLASSACHLWPLMKASEGCGVLHQAALLPATALAAVCVVQDLWGRRKDEQSSVHLMRAVYLLAMQLVMVLQNDTCMVSIGTCWRTDEWMGLLGAASAGMGFAVIPCTMKHLNALCWLMGAGLTATLCLQHHQLRGGLNGIGGCDLEGLGSIACGVMMTCAAVYALRFWMASRWLMAFMDSLRSQQ